MYSREQCERTCPVIAEYRENCAMVSDMKRHLYQPDGIMSRVMERTELLADQASEEPGGEADKAKQSLTRKAVEYVDHIESLEVQIAGDKQDVENLLSRCALGPNIQYSEGMVYCGSAQLSPQKARETGRRLR